jgi:hypothetical protein
MGGRGQVGYRIVQLDEMNRTICHTSGLNNSRRELARSGQVRDGHSRVRYQIVQFDELNQTMYYTWGWVVWKYASPSSSSSPVSES